MSEPIKVNIDKGKLVTFDLDVQGLDEKSILGKFRVVINEVEYGFPTNIEDSQVEVYIPCLHEILKKDHGKFLRAKLEIFADNHFFTPWEGKLDLIESASVKAKVKSSGPRPKVRTEIKDQDVKEEVEVIVDEPEEEVTLPQPKKKKVSEQRILTESTKSKYLEKLKKITEKGIRGYMSRAGTKNETVQNLILEQAEGVCKDPDNKFELLKAVIKVMNQIKSGGIE